MSKEYSSDVDGVKEHSSSKERKKSTSKERKQKTSPQKKPGLEHLSATGFSSLEEQEYVGKVAKLTNAITKIITAPSNDDQTKSKFSDLKDRGVWTLIMILVFCLVISAGNFYCAVLVIIIIACIFNELKDLSKYEKRNELIKNFQLINWYDNYNE